MIFSQLTQAHLGHVIAIALAHRGPHFSWSEKSLRQEFGEASFWGGFGEEGELCAFVAFRFLGGDSDVLEISLLASHPEWSGKGYMRALLAHVFQNFPASKVWLEVSELNSRALKLYRGLDFRVCGRRMGYYPDGSTALLLEKVC